ncbi:MAG TPA: alpha/beta hydrolase [Kofleriaceae bacterium]|nr:alpha/beta hydrolase [Kofleriaceae bacterium]
MADELAARTADGITLRIDRVRSQGDARGAVVCLHAMMTDGRYFGARRPDGFAAALAARGLDVYVADFRGHGRSTPPRAGKDGDWSFDDLVELDLPAIVAAVPPGAALLGHSLGGLVACAALGTGRIPPPRLLALATTSVWLGETAARRAIMAAYRGAAQLAGKAPIRALGIGRADEARTYVEQLTGWSRTGRWTSQRGLDYLAALAAIDVPAVAIASGADWMCRPADAARIATRIATCAPLHVVPGTNHFNLFARDDVRDWFAATIRSRYSST